MINPWRLATAAVLFELGIVVWIAGAGFANIKKTVPLGLNRVARLTADIVPARPPRPAATATAGIAPAAPSQPTVTGHVAISDVDIAEAAADVARTADAAAVPAAPTAVANEPKAAAPNQSKPVVVAAVLPSETTQAPPGEPPSVTVATPATPDSVSGDSPAPKDIATPKDIRDIKDAIDSVAILDECPIVDNCIDRYLFALYQRTPKEDSIKVDEQRKVTVKKKGKTVTVIKTFSTVVDEDFGWKDSKAADKIDMSMADYVIGGMDRAFKLKLFHMLHAAEEAGLSPGITSAFRDDYRQSIASGLHAASDRSYHGGSSRGGYGHGLAADVVSVNGATRALRQVATDSFWKWIDIHGKEFGIGRPYLDRDPPHVGPIDGEEYAKHRGTKTVRAASDAKDRKSSREDQRPAKHAKTARS
jgi:D-alanyl-D-alanine carboxypeptidase